MAHFVPMDAKPVASHDSHQIVAGKGHTKARRMRSGVEKIENFDTVLAGQEDERVLQMGHHEHSGSFGGCGSSPGKTPLPSAVCQCVACSVTI
ncbi:cardiolipin synthase [Anopheles sinensis]|uniref:Cardiolipin synthase n=1 Tax=Anopheles sinensis TaxID=74873 RepID=A0A084W2E0_ANOSI|nr:cardiolipin synthase [Anopheles sinensis]